MLSALQPTEGRGEVNIAPIGTKRKGRPANPKREAIRRVFPEWSPRTQARYARVWTIVEFLGHDIADFMQQHSRPNGSVSVDDLLERAEGMLACHVVKGLTGCQPIDNSVERGEEGK
jgi:hypothetical protein